MSFDVNAFMQGGLSNPLSTQIQSCPEGEFVFMIDSDPAQIQPAPDRKSQVGIQEVKGTKDGRDYHFWTMGLMGVCQDPNVKAKLGRETVKVRLRINLDLDENGRLAQGEGKNVGLGRLLEALGQNKPGWSPQQLLGAGPFIGKVEHTTGKNGEIYADIVRTAKVS